MAEIQLQELFRHDFGLTGVFHAPNDFAKGETIRGWVGDQRSQPPTPGENNYLYLLEQKGRVLRYDKKKESFSLFLDLSPEIEALYAAKPFSGPFPDERGLLTIAFHPEYNTVGSLFRKVFVVLFSTIADPSKYSPMDAEQTPDPNSMTCLAQFRTADNPEKTKNSRMDMLCVPEPQANHNGGGLVFGPDGFLWIGLGDGGGANDEHGPLLDPSLPDSYLGNAQNLMSLHGKLLRIEVVQPMPQKIPYAIPQNNPFVRKEDIGRPEIAHWGFRNPWRMSFNRQGVLFVGDVGQNRREEVDLVTGLGKNFGWRAYEGHELFNARVEEYIRKSGQKVTPALLDYPRTMGTAIVGVTQYEGTLHPQLRNQLVIADFSGHLMGVRDAHKLYTLYKLDKMQFRSLNVSREGELYLTAYDPFKKQAVVYKMLPKTISPKEKLSESESGAIRPKEKMLPTKNNTRQSSNPHKVNTMDHDKIFLTEQDINCIIRQAVCAAQKVKSVFRVDCDGKPAHTRMQIAIHVKGKETAQLVHSMDDAWPGSMDIAKGKAHTAYAFSSNQNALTTTGIRYLSQPKNITNGIVDDIPLWHLGNSNRKGGIIEFPGGIPLYKKDACGQPVKVGAVGVSGDGVDRDETVARAAAKGFEAPDFIRSDTVAGIPFYGPMAEFMEDADMEDKKK